MNPSGLTRLTIDEACLLSCVLCDFSLTCDNSNFDGQKSQLPYLVPPPQ